MLVVINKVKPRYHMHEDSGISRVPTSHTLDIWRSTANTIQRLALLHFVDHLPHIHFLLSFVFREAVESHYLMVSVFRWGGIWRRKEG
ncbi:hypothetical protein ACMFMG_012196 [Clarireedia jacksonii]